MLILPVPGGVIILSDIDLVYNALCWLIISNCTKPWKVLQSSAGDGSGSLYREERTLRGAGTKEITSLHVMTAFFVL